jgi:thiamine biosynthesis protein ThiI
MELVMLRLNEIFLKSNNKNLFIAKLVKNIRILFESEVEIIKKNNRIYLKTEITDDDELFNKIKKIFGVYSFSRVHLVENIYDIILNNSIKVFNELLKNNKTFRIQSKRTAKNFSMSSMELARNLGSDILKRFPNLKVNLDKPEVVINIEVRNEGTYIFENKIKVSSGLPTGTSTKGSILLSGGIDSPVAALMMMKRGMNLNGITFASPPYTSPSTISKIIKLASKISEYSPMPFFLHIVNFTPLQVYLKEYVDEKLILVLQRRSMMRIANEIAKKSNSNCLVTGENLAQVASQTFENINSIDQSSEMLVLRPLIGMDKDDIIELANYFETYETSIIPYEDTCSIFVPESPATKTKAHVLEKIENSLQRLKEIEVELVNSYELHKLFKKEHTLFSRGNHQ